MRRSVLRIDRTTRLAIVLVALALSVAACGGDDGDEATEGGQTTATAAEKTTVTYALPTPPTLEFYPPIVAGALGFFEEEGVEATLAPSAEEIPMTAFLENGDAELTLADVDEVVIAANRGTEITVIFDPQHKNTEGTVVPEESPIQEFSELRGKRVGLASEENTSLFRAQAQSVGVPADEIETVTVGTSGPTVANALREGEIDAYVGAVSDFTALNANGITLRNITPEEIGNFPGNPMSTLPNVLEEKRDALVGFLRAWAKAQYVGLERPEVVEAIVREEIPEEWRNEAVAEAALQNAIDLFTPEGDVIGEIRPEVWENGQELLRSIGVIEATVDIDTILNDELVDEINDWDREEVEQAADAWLEENS
jgi:NitT/TauT family transport system substrate-binding protein